MPAPGVAPVPRFAALAQPVRLQVFRALVVSGQAGLTPGTMAQALDITTNTLSFHLKELTHACLAQLVGAGLAAGVERMLSRRAIKTMLR
jgi:hypothetical protein